MTIKKKSIDTIIIFFCLISPIAPSDFAKQMVIVTFFFLLIKFLFNREKLYYFRTKLLIFFLFLPGIIMAYFYSLEVFFRYFPVLFLIFAFPFSNYQLNHFFLFKTLIFIILYLILSQLLIAFGNDFLIQYRINWYPFQWAEKFDPGPINFFSEIYSRNKRYGGLFYNPNTLAGLVFMYFLIFDILYNYIKKNSNHSNLKTAYFVIFFLVTIGILFTYSRTILATFVFYLLYTNINKKFLKFKFKKSSLIIIMVSIIILLIIFETTILRIFNPVDSFMFKYVHFANYINNASIPNLLFGGINQFFDMEYGCWLASSGLIGLLAFFIFFKTMINIIETTKIFIFSFLLIGIGATVFYNYLMISMVTVLLIINSSIFFETKKNKSS